MTTTTQESTERQLFDSLDADMVGSVAVGEFTAGLARAGLYLEKDRRLIECRCRLEGRADKDRLSFEQFCEVIAPDIVLIREALRGQLVVPDFEELGADLQSIFDDVQKNEGGHVADYIPPLAKVDPDQFGVAVCTVDGQRLYVGDCTKNFSIQSSTKPLTYVFAVEEHGSDRVHRHVGCEPSGRSFNAYALKDRFSESGQQDGQIPHNPLINAGAIMCAGMQRRDLNGEERFSAIKQRWATLTGGVEPWFNEETYLGESGTGDRNRALSYMMKNENAFSHPDGVYQNVDKDDVDRTVELYFKCCSLELSAEHLSTIAATLANGGICPADGERVLKAQTVKDCLSLMYSCGMYDYSGQFAFKIGLPSKSGVGGALLIVVPGLMGVCTWSPRLDDIGNSVRGVEFCRRLADKFAVHSYDNLGASTRIDPRQSRVENHAGRVEEFIWAASKGDLQAVRRLVIRGYEHAADYDGRTPLHLAAAEGHVNVVEYLVDELNVAPSPRDRWDGTPLDDAIQHGHHDAVAFMKARGAETGKPAPEQKPHTETSTASSASEESAVALIFAAFHGDVVALQRAIARGDNLNVADYDLRTPLHLAAAEGNVDVVRYLIAHGVATAPEDRWGGTPLSDAERQGHDDVAALLRGAL